MTNLRRIFSRDGVALAAHEVLSTSHHAAVPRVVFSHATGFHGLMFSKTMSALSPHAHSIAIDHRGHGLTRYNMKEDDTWEMFGDDLLWVVEDFTRECDGQEESSVIGVGHSMGATAMLIAALKEPKRFRALVLYEPIIYPPYLVSPYEIGMKDAPLAIGARRRKYKFSSFADALENFSSKSMFQKFDSEVLRDYVRHGLMRYKDINVDELRKALDLKDYDWNLNESCNEEVCLRCSPDNEAFVYNSVSAHYIRDDLKNLTGVPTLVLSDNEPSSWAEGISNLMLKSTHNNWNDASHFGPFELPIRFADTIRSVMDR